ncbi:hypothetical protein AWB80_07524 [Caballeronia pedi]|uniref:Uncharacterized protein n=1 Tax=Caballeronia pedi TaxID=1777141 RepID=A0A158DV68_9BURK|nr:hypothetical protein [Caballeronia pedi]SAK98454.1 hypothetical protein AWB80_07524 [Caballeronia pedi]
MAMSKKEQAEMAELRAALARARAVRTTEPVAPDLHIGNSPDVQELSGYFYNAHTLEVMPAWTSTVSHGRGYASRREQIGSATQRAIPLYSSRLLALRALRYATEQRVFAELAKIDMLIDEESASKQYSTSIASQ